MSNSNYKLVSSKGKKSRVAAPAPAQRKPDKRKTAAKPAVILTLFIALIAAAIVALGMYVSNLDTIYPNVWAGGTDLSGMTIEEARETLIGKGYESNADDVFATLLFPDGSSFTLSGIEAGFSQDAHSAALAAYEYGRDGSFFGNEIAFIKAYLTRTDMHDVSLTGFNESYVRETATIHAQLFNNTLMDDAYQINENNIVIIKGITFSPADESAVLELAKATLVQAMAEKSHLTVEYVPGEASPKEIDLLMLLHSVYREPVSAVYDPATFSATQSAMGVSFDLDEARAMLNRAGMGERVVIPLISVEPEVSTQDIESLLFRDVLAETTTYVAGTANRLNNVMLSSSFIDGTMLNPDDVFSFNRIVGERTAQRGFKEAGAYVGITQVQEIGGGICQTSSTIYYNVLKADLQVLERLPHNMTIGYLPLGGDATINWGTIDLRFRNSTDYPIKIEIEMVDRNLTVRFIGTKLDDNYMKITYTLISTTPVERIEREDESIPEGETKVFSEGSTGYVVDTYKNLYDANDNLISTTLVDRSTYSVQHRVILVPPEQPDGEEEETEEPDGRPEEPGDAPEEPTEEPIGEPGDTPEEPGAPIDEPGAPIEDPYGQLPESGETDLQNIGQAQPQVQPQEQLQVPPEAPPQAPPGEQIQEEPSFSNP